MITCLFLILESHIADLNTKLNLSVKIQINLLNLSVGLAKGGLMSTRCAFYKENSHIVSDLQEPRPGGSVVSVTHNPVVVSSRPS